MYSTNDNVNAIFIKKETCKVNSEKKKIEKLDAEKKIK